MNKTQNNIRLALFIMSFLAFFLFFKSVYKTLSTPSGWEDSYPFTDKEMDIFSYHTAQKGSLVALAAHAKYENSHGLYTMISFDMGKSFFKPQKVADLPPDDQEEGLLHPRVAISSSGEISVVWQYFADDSAKYRIYGTTSNDKGSHWSDAKVLFSVSEMEILPFNFFDDQNRLHLIFHGLEKEKFSIFHTIRNPKDGYTKATKISSEEIDVRGAFFPAVVFYNKTIYIVWQGKENTSTLADDLYFTSSPDYGKNWSTSIRVTTDSNDDSAPTMVEKDGALYLAYQNNSNTNWEIYLLRGLSGGSYWDETPTKVSDTNVNCYHPIIQKSSDNEIHTFWIQPEDERNVIVHSHYDTELSRFDKSEIISQNTNSAEMPMTLASGPQLISLWIEDKVLKAKTTDTYVAPPQVISKTHPYGKWSQFGTAEIQWKSPEDSSGIAGYATIVNNQKHFDPTVQNIETGESATRVPFLRDGISYFHIRAIDNAGNYSRTIHYPLLVSASPLSVPKIESSSHEEGKSSDKREARFSWSIDDEERAKGFYYSFSSNSVQVPKRFIQEKELEFDHLKDGRYFLSVRAIDKTGKPGRIATFELLVGDVKKLTEDDYNRMAKELERDYDYSDQPQGAYDYIALEGEPGKEEPLLEPEALLFIDANSVHQDGHLKFTISLKGVSPDEVEILHYTYTLFHDGLKIISDSQNDGYFEIKKIKPGNYNLTANIAYRIKKDPNGTTRYTRQVEETIDFRNIPQIPVDQFYERITTLLINEWQLNAVFILSLSSALLFSFGFFKAYYVMRVQVMRIFQRLLLLFQH